jgi:hypothetical protein
MTAHKHHVVVAPIERGANHVGVGVEARRVLIDRQVHCDYVMTGPLEKRSQHLPAPRAVPRAVYQAECRHAVTVTPGVGGHGQGLSHADVRKRGNASGLRGAGAGRASKLCPGQRGAHRTSPMVVCRKT